MERSNKQLCLGVSCLGERFGVEIDSWDLSANRQYFKTQVWLQQMIIVQCPLQGEMEDCFSISEPHKQYEKGKEMIPENEAPRQVGRCPTCSWEERRNSFRKNEEAGPKWK